MNEHPTPRGLSAVCADCGFKRAEENDTWKQRRTIRKNARAHAKAKDHVVTFTDARGPEVFQGRRS